MASRIVLMSHWKDSDNEVLKTFFLIGPITVVSTAQLGERELRKQTWLLLGMHKFGNLKSILPKAVERRRHLYERPDSSGADPVMSNSALNEESLCSSPTSHTILPLLTYTFHIILNHYYCATKTHQTEQNKKREREK